MQSKKLNKLITHLTIIPMSQSEKTKALHSSIWLKSTLYLFSEFHSHEKQIK